MPIITFWSNNEKTIGQTVAAATAATVMAVERNYKVLLISADFNNNVIEKCFGEQQSNKDIVKTLVGNSQVNLDSGIKGLLKLSDSNRVAPELIHDYTKIIFKNRLEVLYSPMNIIDEQEKAKIIGQMKNIIINASRYYDHVFVDLKKGFKYSEQIDILNASDVVILNSDQNIENIKQALNTKEINSLQHKTIWNICKYDKKSKYNIKNLARTILKKQTICETNYNTLLMEATQEGAIAELLLRFKTLREDDENTIFMTKMKEFTEAILLKYHESRTRR